jgi:hypothetical protein
VKTIRNTTRLPIKVPLPGGKVLHLGPARTGQITDGALAREPVQSMLKSGTIEILGEGAHRQGAGTDARGPHEETRGHHSSKPERPRGNR